MGIVTLAALATAGCNAIFGLEAGQERPPVSTGGSSAAGGVAGIGGTSTGAGGTAGSGGTGGQPPTLCTAFSMGECGGGMKCSVYDVDAGAWGCVEAGPRPVWSYCQQDVECQEGTWCDLESSVCKPVCQNGNACPLGGSCHPAAGNGEDIPGLQICTAYCDPIDPNSCSQSYGPTNCIVTDTISFDCYASGSNFVFSPCGDSFECAPALGCYQAVCRRWCVDDSDCGGFPCVYFTPALFYGPQEYGMCH